MHNLLCYTILYCNILITNSSLKHTIIIYIITISFDCSAVLSRIVPWNKCHIADFLSFIHYFHILFLCPTEEFIQPWWWICRQSCKCWIKENLVHLKWISLFRRNELQNSLNLCLVTKCSNVPFLMFVLSKEKMERSYLESLIRSDLFTNPQVYKYLTCTSQLYKDY